MTYIDWISPPEHLNFNRAFFSAIDGGDSSLVVFARQLQLEGIDCRLVENVEGRLARALYILKFCRSLVDRRVFFLTYDPVFLPLVMLACKPAGAFEHNTTPEHPFNKHAVWQRLFLRRLCRCAQYQGQHARLKNLGQKSFYVGSPLSLHRTAGLPRRPGGEFVLASYRVSPEEFQRVAPFLEGSKVIVKESVAGQFADDAFPRVSFAPVKYIDFDVADRAIRGVIITVSSRIRGSGWFNDAIARGVPVIVTNPGTAQLFEETFPGVPFVNAARCASAAEFQAMLLKCRDFDPRAYVEEHNRRFRQRFDDAVAER